MDRKKSLLHSTKSIAEQFFSQKLQLLLFVSVGICFVVYLSYNILSEANWIFGDNHQNLTHTAIGKPFYFFGCIPSAKRFFPLAFMDYNILLLFFDTPSALIHYCWNVVTFIVFAMTFVYLLYCIARDNVFSYGLLVLSVFFVSLFYVKDFMLLFIDVVFPERILVVTLSIFLVFYYQARKYDNLFLYICSIPFCVIATYHKEPVIGIFLAIAVFNFIFNRSLSKNAIIYNVLLLLNVFIYILLFYILVYSVSSGVSYNEGRFLGGIFSAINIIFIKDKVLFVALLVGIVRSYFLFFKKEQEEHSFFDATLYAGLAYAIAFVILKLPTASYYTIPAIVLVFPSFFYWTLKSYQLFKTFPLLCTGLIALIPISHADDLQEMIEHHHHRRTHDIVAIEPLAEAYKDGYHFVYLKQPILKKDHAFSGVVLRDYFRTVTSLILDYMLKNDKQGDKYFIFDEILSAKDIDSKTIVLYPLQNDLEQSMHPETKTVLEANFHSPFLISQGIHVYLPLSMDIYKKKVKNLQTFSFGEQISAEELVGENAIVFTQGWSLHGTTDWWTDGTESTFYIKVDKKAKALLLKGVAFLEAGTVQDISISVNGDVLWHNDNITTYENEITLNFSEKLIQEIQENPVAIITMSIPTAKSPAELGLWGETRRLGFSLNSITLF